MKHIIRRSLLIVAGTVGLIAATADPVAAGINVNHTEPSTAAR